MTEPARIVERRAEKLAREAAELAARLAREDGEKATALAVARAVKDANVDRDLRDHEKHLAEINGSQRQMADSLKKVERGVGQLAESWEKQLAVNEALEVEMSTRQSKGLSRWMVILGLFTGLGAYSGLIYAAVSH